MLLAVLIALAPSVWGQAASYSFERIDLEAGEGEFDVSGRIHHLVGGADVTLYSAEPGSPNLRLRANRMDFEYPAEGGQPTAIKLEGNVVIEHPEGTVLAGRADWNLTENRMVFSQNPVVKNAEQFGEIRGETIDFDLGTGAIKVQRPVVKDVQFQQSAPQEPTSPGLLAVDDVDWPTLLAVLKEQQAATAPSPGQRVMALLDANARRFVETSTVDDLVASRETVLKQLNRVLQQRELYSAEAWAGIALGPEAQALLDKGADMLSGEEVVQLNRRLLEAAYPGAIQPAS
jgi:hypothetical protein